MTKELQALIEVNYVINEILEQKFTINVDRKTDLKFFFDFRFI